MIARDSVRIMGNTTPAWDCLTYPLMTNGLSNIDFWARLDG